MVDAVVGVKTGLNFNGRCRHRDQARARHEIIIVEPRRVPGDLLA
ncbi:hypothetical protein [Nocardia sp. alder85J]|nr:hypothetical protein [Nocardia sp. alder85J]